MSDQSLVIGSQFVTDFKYTQNAIALKESALATSALIGKVTNSTENEQAVIAQTELKTVIKLVEDARVKFKQPVLDYCRDIDSKAKAFSADLSKELSRVSTIIGNFQQLELAKARAAEAARIKDLEEIERRKQEALAQANSHEELEAIHERANQEAAAVVPVQVVKAKGQTVTTDWEVTVTNGVALANAYPECVKIEPKLREIKALLNAGLVGKIPGIIAKPIVKADVRLQRESALIEV
jgi:hypothetical protein